MIKEQINDLREIAKKRNITVITAIQIEQPNARTREIPIGPVFIDYVDKFSNTK